MRKILNSIMLSAVVVLGLVACGNGGSENTSTNANNSGDSNVSQDIYNVRFAHVGNTESYFHKLAEKWKELVEENSEGRIEVDIYPGGQLGHDRQLVESLPTNNIQVVITGGTLPILDTRFSVVDMPYIFTDTEDARSKLGGDLGNALFDLLPDHKIKGLAWGENGFKNVTNSVRPIHSPDDLKGLKIRVAENQVHIDSMEALGVNVVPMPFTELFTALEQKVVDGQENPVGLIHSSKFQEVQSYLSLTEHFYNTGALLMSLDFYEGLPDDLQKVVDEASLVARDYQYEIIDHDIEESLKKLEEEGMEIVREINKEPFIELTQSVYEKYGDQIGEELLELARQ
ncbi:DctP family TRAP transporter solute-binding subunit [Halalkalibacter alkaliphilus]|uniref:DctP family TRAP transporter solute-binding subunit n=1 Tax=Halalkalibacter alkaliphilus TaxID=2917993 RepID=A0A9X2IAL4_9BACI|nr:DctP family TRAP transporter solute-binding subunit [Halalkalibacter alkaliphilus]MCL7749515.1 DctP family TRAP transporter solute-binding subunit [Halalkalibacter alkaliphilus]